ncbi:hypothetical protein MMC10_004065 [Thelotrema lepadinum]|nr:hypothetical protein [Thelotrema lepadinum]
MALPLVDKQNRGQVLYRQGKYREALEIFSSILEKWHDPPISVLDNRAATYMKLKEFPKALKDARSMINREKAMASGYLRAGQVLQRMDENDKAQGIYEYGLKNVSVGDSKLLRGVLEDLRAKCAPAKAMDVLMELPVELIEMILSYLSFRNIV